MDGSGDFGDGSRYIDPDIGLLASTLAEDIVRRGPLAVGGDDHMWSYAGGVWSPDPHVVRNRASALLGEEYRRSHATNAEDIIRARAPRITCDPVSRFINVRNGLLDWRMGELLPHDPSVLSTVQLSVDYRPGATCPEVDAFLAQVLPPDVVSMMWELIGYLIYSGNPLHKAVMLMGTGRNGKGTFLRLMLAILGARNVTSASLHDLVNTRFTTASLFGKTANIAGDIDGTYLESTATFKAVTGQDQISAEHKGRDRFDFTPWALPVFSANKIPGSADVTVGYLARWVVVPFPNDFTGKEDRHLDERLQQPGELAGVLNRALPSLRQLMDRGEFDLPESAVTARESFQRKVDQVRTWLDECVVPDPLAERLPRTLIYGFYRNWALRDGHKPVKAGEFYERLAAAGGVPKMADSGQRCFDGLKIIDQAQPPGRDDPNRYPFGRR